MKYISKEELPVEIKNNKLPEDNKCLPDFYEEDSNPNSGFVNAIFLAGMILVSFMWGMLAIILKG